MDGVSRMIDVPSSENIVELSIINTTADLVCPTSFFLEPNIVGQEYLNLPTYSFLVQNRNRGKNLLFDFGGRKDWKNLAPSTVLGINKGVKEIQIEQSVDEILKQSGVGLDTIDYLVISHAHWDHIGDPSKLPASVRMVVGPGLRAELSTGYPAQESSATLESDIAGKEVIQIEFDGSLSIGGLQAHDFFGDGSFYILDTPGHAVGHISALARTTKDTFVFLGGDVCHYAGGLRPSQAIPMPDIISREILPRSCRKLPCPCNHFTHCHWDKQNGQELPFYNITTAKESWFMIAETAQKSLESTRVFDAAPNVLVALAHDIGLRPVATFFPEGVMNNWKQEGWKEKSYWGFLDELPIQ